MRFGNLLSAMAVSLVCFGARAAEETINVTGVISAPGEAKPTWVSISGITGEALQALQFDLYVQGFGFTNSEGAQYLIAGSNNGSLQAKATDAMNKNTLVSKAYSGGSLRRQVHTFVDEFTEALHMKPIAK